MFYFLIALPLLFAGVSLAELSSPVELESAAVLPAGVRSPRIKFITTAIDSRWGNDGVAASLAGRLNRTVGWKEVVQGQRTAAEKATVESILDTTPGLSLSGTAGQTTAQVNTSTLAAIPTLSVGLTERLTAALLVPILRMDMSATTGFVKSTQGQEFINQVATASSPAKAQEIAGQLNTALDATLAANGYKPLQSSTLTGVGDIRVVARYVLLKDSDQALAIRPAVLIPTGKMSDPDQVASPFTGDGRWNGSLTVAYDRAVPFVSNLNWLTYASYTALMPASSPMRVPDTSPLTPDKDDVTRQFANQVGLGTSLTYAIRPAGLTLGAGYGYQYGGSQSFSGTKYAPARYAAMALADQNLHTLTVSANFSTTGWYRQKSFPVPFDFNLSYTQPLAGKNVNISSVLNGEVVAYF